ncbi:hypothetical protein N7468_007797 [Penicillium chermesinum]|uniref:Cation diffusion facilitator n=1 Tax=Penicillium chermesinum TaxID=63820 RepID=A0A9W9NNJ7_9EURO|nr:uncharacterized protein N7468_007797 [Penicillium chermesinum]KAJ5223255.1 hypothetical protein N7468_007797 [Penicillium chermesinum]
MTSQPFLPLSSSPASPTLQPRRPSLDPERDILSTRGRIHNLLPSHNSSTALQDLEEFAVTRKFLRRGSLLIGHKNARYEWQRYYRSPESLKGLRKPVRKYYERNNWLISQYLYIDRLLDSSLPHNLIDDYDDCHHHSPHADGYGTAQDDPAPTAARQFKAARVKRTPHNLYQIPDETAPLLSSSQEEDHCSHHSFPDPEAHSSLMPEKEERLINLAIRVNFAANVVLLASKIVIMVLTSSMSVLAGLVDGVLDFLSTLIIWVTTKIIRQQDRNRYPITRRRLEPVSVLVFSVIMVTSFFQVGLSSFNRLTSEDHAIVELSMSSIGLMAGTVLVKLLCWIWCRLIPSPSVQVLAQDAMTDVIFNTFSIIFPLIGAFFRLWYMDPLGGLFLSCYIMWNWGQTAGDYIRRLTGAAASATDHNILLYMTMRFSRVVRKIQDLKAYYAGDKLNVEVDLVVDEGTSLRDAHDVGESLQYILESVPTVDRAWVHLDYSEFNLPSHLNQLDR